MDGNRRALTKHQTGAGAYSPWYKEKFAKEHFANKKTELAETHTDGDLEKFSEWLKRAQRRFQSLFDRLSDESKRAYQSSARHFGRYIGLRKAKVSEIVARLISLSYIEASTLVEEYIKWMAEDEELAPNTINRHVAALRFFVDTARRVGWVEYKLDVRGVKTQKVKDLDAFSERDFRRILRTVQRAQGKTSARNKLLVYMLAFMGVRISSALSLDYENIDFERGRFKLRWKGEGRNYVWRPAGPIVFAALDEWLEERGTAKGHIFASFDPGKKGSGRITLRSAERIISEIGSVAGTKKKLRTHSFRHFYADDNLKASNQNTRDVSGGLGHKNIKTIEEYVTKGKGDKRTRKLNESMERRWIVEYDEEDLENEEAFVNDEDDEYEEEIEGVVSADEAIENRVEWDKIGTGMDGVDRVFGGGIVAGSLLLLGGNPGIGKSTLVRQICAGVCRTNAGMKVLYASGEETVEQIAEMLHRIRAKHKNFKLTSERNVNIICQRAEKIKAGVVVIDSINAGIVDGNDKAPGSITQLKGAAQFLMDWVKGTGDKEDPNYEEGSGISVIIIGHVDKKGNIGGPRMLEHFVDSVFKFTGAEHTRPRLLSSTKNRFGDTTKIANFDMTKRGLVEKASPHGYDDDADDDEEDDEPLGTFGDDEEDDDLEDEGVVE